MKKLFFALALVQLVPVWAPVYFPTQDGAAHVYNAAVIRELALGHHNRLTQTYELDLRPHPNVVSHIVLALLLGVFPPAAAEKILVSAIVVLFLGAVWLFAGALDPGARVYAYLALPLAHHQLLQYGFYNFCIATALSLMVIAFWWKRRYVAVAILLVVCYFSHPLPTAFAVMAIGIEWLLTLRTEPFRQHARRLLALVPVLPLLDWYAMQNIGKSGRPGWTALERLRFLAQTEICVTFDYRQRYAGTAIFAATAALMIVTAMIERRRRGAAAFLVILAVLFVIYMIAPADAAGGAFVLQRLALLAAVAPLPWLTPRLPRPWQIALAAAMATISIAQAAFLTVCDRRVSRQAVALVRAARRTPPDHTMLPLIGNRHLRGVAIQLLAHTSCYAATGGRLVDLDNYEPTTSYFPLRFRRGVAWRPPWDIEEDPNDVDLEAWTPIAEYVFTWRLRPDAPVYEALAPRYALVWSDANARIYRRRD